MVGLEAVTGPALHEPSRCRLQSAQNKSGSVQRVSRVVLPIYHLSVLKWEHILDLSLGVLTGS